MIKKLFNSGIFWTIVIGIVGFGLTILFYEYSNKEREPVYVIKKEPSLIFDKENSSPKIKLLSNDSLVINNNVYLTSIVIWNNGELEINKADVRKEFKVGISNNAKILDYKIINQTNPEISNFRILPTNDELVIDWDYFDPKFGFELQIIYSGNAKSEIIVEGYVLGKEIKKVTQKKPSNFMNYFILIALFFFILSSFLFYKMYKKTPDKLILALLIFTILMILFSCFNTYRTFFAGFEMPL